MITPSPLEDMKKLTTNQTLELAHIYNNQPVSAGDTLCGGEVVASLKRIGYIDRDCNGDYCTTRLGSLMQERKESHDHLAEIHNRYKSVMTAKINEKTQTLINKLK